MERRQYTEKHSSEVYVLSVPLMVMQPAGAAGLSCETFSFTETPRVASSTNHTDHTQFSEQILRGQAETMIKAVWSGLAMSGHNTQVLRSSLGLLPSNYLGKLIKLVCMEIDLIALISTWTLLAHTWDGAAWHGSPGSVSSGAHERATASRQRKQLEGDRNERDPPSRPFPRPF
jgi:hypothetical protein